ncbi:transposase [bacterium]|nr:transposase [bacterium]
MSNYKRYYLKENSYIFITVVTYNRKEILTDNIELLKEAFKRCLIKFDFEIFAICVMKNHIHMILKEKELKNYTKIIAIMKKHFSYNLSNKPNKNSLSESMIKRKEAGVWQRRFYDHILRDEQDLYKHIDYIHYNSYKHYKILPRDWEYSSFKKFVKLGFYEQNWCDFNLENIDLE